MTTDNYNLLAEIDDYIESKNKIYEELKSSEIESNIDVNDIDESLIENSDFIEKQNNIKQYFNTQYNNNIVIGEYLDNKIKKLNLEINSKNNELADLRKEKQEYLTHKQTVDKQIDIEYNNITVNKIINYIAKIIIASLIMMILICMLKDYNVISDFTTILLNIIIMVGLVSYIFYIIKTDYPREADDYYRYKFEL